MVEVPQQLSLQSQERFAIYCCQCESQVSQDRNAKSVDPETQQFNLFDNEIFILSCRAILQSLGHEVNTPKNPHEPSYFGHFQKSYDIH
jgi:hypothetical protein